MSQSRGGDQATVNTDGSLEFYGGTVAGSTKRTKIKARIIATAFADHIANADTVFVMGHYFSDLDSVGASVGVYSIVKALGKQCYIVCNKETSMAKNLIEGLDEKAIPGAFITGDEAKGLITSKGLLVITDTHRPDTLDYKELLPEFENVVVIDHHRRTADYINSAVLYYDEPNASSACELVTELIRKTELLPALSNGRDKRVAGYLNQMLKALKNQGFLTKNKDYNFDTYRIKIIVLIWKKKKILI